MVLGLMSDYQFEGRSKHEMMETQLTLGHWET